MKGDLPALIFISFPISCRPSLVQNTSIAVKTLSGRGFILLARALTKNMAFACLESGEERMLSVVERESRRFACSSAATSAGLVMSRQSLPNAHLNNFLSFLLSDSDRILSHSGEESAESDELELPSCLTLSRCLSLTLLWYLACFDIILCHSELSYFLLVSFPEVG